jgi:hypothetical protein
MSTVYASKWFAFTQASPRYKTYAYVMTLLLHVQFESITAAVMENTIFWIIAR